jgi:hypothetical protein
MDKKAELKAELTSILFGNVPEKFIPLVQGYVENMVEAALSGGGLSLVSMTDAALMALAGVDDEALEQYSSADLVLAFINMTDHAAKCYTKGMLDEKPLKASKTPSNVN